MYEIYLKNMKKPLRVVLTSAQYGLLELMILFPKDGKQFFNPKTTHSVLIDVREIVAVFEINMNEE